MTVDLSDRTSAIRIVLFNHKGGVGKTTLTANLAIAVADQGYRVLLVDSDPQCNLTSYLVADEVVDDLLDRSDGPRGQTVWSAVKPVSEAIGSIKLIKPIEIRDRLFLIPGDVRLSEFEVELNDLWAQCLQRRIRGFRGTSALSTVVSKSCERNKIDFVFYDAGPNIGPLNRVILLDSDYLIVPVAADLFSLRALKTLGRTLVGWIDSWETVLQLAPEGTYLLPGKPAFLGYVPQGYRIYGGLPASKYSHFLSRIEKGIHDDLIGILRQQHQDLAPGRLSQYKLGEVPNLSSLVPASYEQGVAIYEVNAGTQQQKDKARALLEGLAKKIVQRTRQ